MKHAISTPTMRWLLHANGVLGHFSRDYRGQNVVVVLRSIINILKGGEGDIFDHLTSMRIFNLIINKLFI